MKVHILSFRDNVIDWEKHLAARLAAAGYGVHIEYREAAPSAPLLKSILALESRRFGAAAQPAPFTAASQGHPDAIIDLTDKAGPGPAPVLTIEIGGSPSLSEGLLRLRSGSGPIDLLMRCDGRPVGQALPMIQDRVWLTRDIEQVLASVQSLFVHSLARLRTGLLQEIAEPPPPLPARHPASAYASRLVGGLAARALKKMTPGPSDLSWSTAYRLIDGPGVAETRRIDGVPFLRLEDDGQRFYADPFLIEHEGRCHLFVEEYPHATHRGVISVAELGEDGRFGRPRIVLEEPHHLSYPNVFSHEGAVFMIPESGAANEVVLYRAQPFPDRWVREAVLIEGPSLADMTLLHHEGRFWMFGVQRFDGGSASDTMAVYSAERLHGPWTAHPLNPILIDRAGARPGGQIVTVNGKRFLPVQNGTDAYGRGLGLREILRLDTMDIRLGPTLPILRADSAGHASLHTLNRAGRVEVIDQFEE